MKVSFSTILSAPVSQVFNNLNPGLYGGDRKHKGIDYAVMVGTPVYACMDGDIQFAKNVQTGYGRHVKIIHTDGSMSIYGHLQQIDISEGAKVIAGQKIGISGGDKSDNVNGDGSSTGPHLHWEIRPPGKHASDQSAVDPMIYCLQYVAAEIKVGEATGGLYVRSMPDQSYKAVGSIFRKSIAHIVEEKNGWGRINSLRPEWVSMKYIYLTGETITVKDSSQVTELPAQDIEDPSDSEKLKILWQEYKSKKGIAQ